MAYFGDNSYGGYTLSLGATGIVGSPYAMDAVSGASAVDLKAYMYNTSGGSVTSKGAIYDNSYNLIATTNEASCPTGVNLVTFTFSSPPALTASATYILCVWQISTTCLCTMDNTGGTLYYETRAYGSFPDPWSPSTYGSPYRCNIICDYSVPMVSGCGGVSNII